MSGWFEPVVLGEARAADAATAASSPGGAASEQPLSPAQALGTFQLGPGLRLEVAAAEPAIGQPVYLTFDERGRIWLVEYRQFPWPEGLKVVGHDEYWRVKYDKFPPPAPPHQVPGADRVVILEDKDGDGVFESVKPFIEKLNICTAALPGREGVWVMNPPYLLFYPDANHDDVPDGDPIVHLAGFGLEDMHAVANSLTWGPDGWLYGLQGSTCTAAVWRPGIDEESEALSFKGQCVWRYQPETRTFELFAEGGYNNFGLAMDKKGRLFTGTNGGKIGVHYVQGGYYQKTWGKHGPLTNPYAFGWFEAMTDHSSQAKLSQAMAWYEDGPLPEAYHHKLIVARILQERIDVCDLRPEGSTYSAWEMGPVCSSSEKFFRPVDIKEGPDGALYIADWHEANVTWNVTAEGARVLKNTGRIYRLCATNAPRGGAIDYSALKSDALADLLRHTNQWHRQMALRIMNDRKDRSLIPKLSDLVLQGRGQIALEALWGLRASGGLTAQVATRLLEHADPEIREWTVRFVGDGMRPTRELEAGLRKLAKDELDVHVRSQIACSSRRVSSALGLALVRALTGHVDDAKDPHLPLLLWWGIETHLRHEPDLVFSWLEEKALWTTPVFRSTIASRLGQRFTTERTPESLRRCARLLGLAPDQESLGQLIHGMERGLSGDLVRDVPPELNGRLSALWGARSNDPEMMRVAVRLGNREAVPAALRTIEDPAAPENQRIELLRLMAERGEPAAVEVLLKLLRESKSARLQAESLGALQRFGEERVAQAILSAASQMDAGLRERAFTVLASRASWAMILLRAVDGGVVQPRQVAPDIVLALLSNAGAGGKDLVAKHWGNVRKTPDELKKRMAEVLVVLGGGVGDPRAGREIFAQNCAKCHVLYGQGKKVGPELTGVDRKDLPRLVQSVVDPSNSVLPEFTPFQFTLKRGAGPPVGEDDDQVLTGFVVEENANAVTVVDTAGNQATIARSDILKKEAMSMSIMPEGLLDAYTPGQIRDLFSYVQSQTPPPP